MSKVTRIGLLNFWLYDEEEFDFYDGKLLLRGANGSGKSVTMQSFIPLILDGNKSPSRLDPFGTTDKHIEDYLLGGIDNEQKDEATGYLYMEVYDDKKEKYITIGMGLHARRGRPVDFWGFALQDGRRIGKDFLLYKSKSEKIPFSKNELKFALGGENILVDTTREYKEMVNHLLFSFPNLDSYDEFINVLLQLRSPKLSKEYKPTKLMAILSSVLQPLTEDNLRPLSDAIEEMDKTKEKIEQLEADAKQLEFFMKTLRNYNETILYKKAERLIDSTKEKNEVLKIASENKNLKVSKEQAYDEIDKKIVSLELEYERVKAKRENLDSKDLDSKVNRQKELITRNKELNGRQEKLETDIERKKGKERTLQQSIESLKEEQFKSKQSGLELLENILELCEDVKLQEASSLLKDLQKDFKVDIDFNYLENRIRNYQIKLKQIKERLIFKQDKEEKLSALEDELAKITKEYQKLTVLFDEKEEKITILLRDIKDSILLLNKKNQFVKISDEERDILFSYLKSYQISTFEKAKSFYQKIASKFYNGALEEVSHLKAKLIKAKEELDELSLVLEELKSQDEEEIPLDQEELETKNYLEEKGIPYLEFYKAIDFKADMKEDLRDKLESVLLTSGILSAKIILAKDKSFVVGHLGRFLCASSKKAKNLGAYFVPVENDKIPLSEITKVLESISIDPSDEVHIFETDYQMDYFLGFGSASIPSKYIGVLKRKEEKQRKIKEQEDKVESAKAIINQLQGFIEKKNYELSIIEQETNAFPSNESLNEIKEGKEEIQVRLDILLNSQKGKAETIDNIRKEIEKLLKEMIEMKKEISLPLYLETFLKAIENTNQLMLFLSKLENYVKEYLQKEEMQVSSQSLLQETLESLDDLRGDLNRVQFEYQKNDAEIKDLEAILNTEEYRDLSKTLMELEEKLENIPNQLRTIENEKGSLAVEIRNLQEEEVKAEKEIQKLDEIVNLRKSFFQEEYNLHYVMDSELEDVLGAAKRVLSDLNSRQNSDLGNVTNNYYEAFNTYRLSLNNYNLTSVTLFEKDSDEEIFKEAKRFDIEAMYQGKKMNIYALKKALEEAILENHEIISEQDRKLFEEILLKTVGGTIRDRIYSSKAWVREINDIMAVMQKGSALSFGLDWRSKDAESMDELETKELVRLFTIDESIRNKSDTDNLVKHFRSKLRKAMEYSKDTEPYAKIIFDILDYRNWFEFRMTYQRASENKRELTDKVFSVFSGGEKAKTMYIPLFAAVSAKLEDAKENALRLVALDEAFAGVDEINIKEMFGIMGMLNLDYILTSQALWGDYDTIKELAVAELLRPKNSSVVGVRRYKWNGKTKEYIQNRVIDDDVIELF